MIHSTKLISKTFKLLKNIPFLPILIDEQVKIITLFLRPNVFSKMIELNNWIKSLEGVKTKYHKYGGIEFNLNENEICHIHGDGLVDVKLNKEVKNEFLLNHNEIEPHHELPTSSMISYQIKAKDDLVVIKYVIGKSFEIINKMKQNNPL